MTRHNLELERCLARFLAAGMSRRAALKALAVTGMAAAGAPLFASAGLADTGQAVGPGGIPLARPDTPVTLPLHGKAIAGGLKPETGGTFRLFNYADYLDKKAIDDFGKKYGVAMELTSFDSMDQAITRLASRAVQPDVTNITPDRLAQAVAGKLLKPINLDYIPNLEKNIWPSLHSPFYDVGSRYTVPYTTYATGIGWRADKISEDIAKMDNPWSIFWQSQKYKGYVGVLDDSREALVLAMLYRGFYDINTEDPTPINRSLADLKALIPICNPKINITDYQTLPSGVSWLHQSWSGSVLSAYLYNLPSGDDGSYLRFWSPAAGKGPVQNDCWAILANTRKPVLAHLFLNYLLDEGVAYHNFVDFNGYQPPQVSVTAESLIADKVIPEQLRSAIFTSDAFGPASLQESALTVKGQALWQKAYARFSSGT